MTQRIQTLFLMADPSFLFGAARVGDLFGQFDQFNFSRTPEEADARALASDWIVVGYSLVDAMAEYRSEESHDEDMPGQLELAFRTR